MSTAIGTITSEGMSENTIETYIGVNHVVLFAHDSRDRDGIGVKILLDEKKLNELIENLQLAGQGKGWLR